MSKEYELAIVGGGVAGLSAAYFAHQHGFDFVLLESSDRFGGCIKTSSKDEYFFECGPNTIALGETINSILYGLNLPIKKAQTEGKIIFSEGKLHPLNGPIDLLFGNLLSLGAKLSLFIGIFKSHTFLDSVSIGEFFESLFCKEIVKKLVHPIVTGIYSGDPYKLSMKAVFPSILEAFNSEGSLFKGLIKKKRLTKRVIVSFEGGLQELITKTTSGLPSERLLLNHKVKKIESDSFDFLIETESEKIKCRKLILATPAYGAAALAEEYCSELKNIDYAAVRTINILIPSQAINESKLKLFQQSLGFLSAENSSGNILGVLFISSMFPNNSSTKVQVTCFSKLGTEISQLDKDLDELAKILEIEKNSLEVLSVNDWPRAIPQYNEGHVQKIRSTKEKLPTNLKIIGNYLGGVSLEDTIKSGKLAIEELLLLN